MTIHRDLSELEILAIRDGVLDDIYIPNDVEPKIVFKIDETLRAVDTKLYAMYVDNVAEEPASDKITKNTAWVKTKPMNDNHVKYYENLGIKISADNTSEFYDGMYFVPYKTEFLCFQQRGQPMIFDVSGRMVGTLPIPYGTPSSTNSLISYCTAADYEETKGRVAMVSGRYDFIRVYKLDIEGDYVKSFDIGVPRSRDYKNPYVTAGKLYQPADVNWLPNGNLLVTCKSGLCEAGDPNSGYIMEINGDTGAFIRKVCGSDTAYDESGVGSTDVKYPTRTLLDPKDPTRFFVYEYGASRMIINDLDTGANIKLFASPQGIRPNGGKAFGLINDGNTLLSSNDRYQVYAQDVATGDLLWVKDAKKNEFTAKHSGNFSYGNFLEVTDGIYAMGDYSYRRMIFGNADSTYTIQYSPPYDTPEELAAVLNEFEPVKLWGSVGLVDLYAFTTEVDILDIPNVTEVLMELRRK